MSSRDVSVIAALWIVLIGCVAVAGARTGNWYVAGLAAGFVGGLLTDAYLDRSRSRRRVLQAAATHPKRTCPSCGSYVRREAAACSKCGAESTPWARHDDVWWVWGRDGAWHWLDEEAGVFRSLRDGAPSSPSAIGHTATRG